MNQKNVYETAVSRGQWKDGVHGALYALRGEVSELMAEFQRMVPQMSDKLPDRLAFEEELADVALTCFSIAERMGVNLHDVMQEKAIYNMKRGVK